MKPRTLFPVAMIILSLNAPANAQQTKEQDSLRSVAFDYSLHDTIRLQAGNHLLADYYRDQCSDSLLYYSRLFYQESVKADYIRGMVQFKYLEGNYYTNIRKYNEALKCYLDALEIAEKSGQLQLIHEASNWVGIGYWDLRMFDKASEYLLRTLAISRELKDLKKEIAPLTNLGLVYTSAGYVQKAEDAYLRVISLVDSLKIDPVRKAYALNNLGYLYARGGKTMEAIRALHEAAQLFQQNNNLLEYHNTLFHLAGFLEVRDTLNLYGKEVRDNRKSLDIAIDYTKQCESWCRKRQDTSMLVLTLICKARIYIKKGDMKKALYWTREAEKLNVVNMSLGRRVDVLYNLAYIYNKYGDYKTSVKYYTEHKHFYDSLQETKNADMVRQLTESFEIEQMEGQVKQKEEQLAKNRVITFLFIGISALILILAGIVLYFLRQKQKAAKLLEEQNREIEKARYRAEQSEKFKERFLASMSHEIRTPLNAVIGMTGLLLDDPQPPKTEHYLRNIKQAGEHLTGIINQILDLSRIDAGKLDLHEAPFSMNDLMEEIGNLLGGKAKEKELQLIIHKAEGTPNWFCGDAGRIRQVLLNLTGNALKFTQQGSVQVKVTSNESIDGKAMVHFSVEDTGIGIPKEMQAVIFVEFVQAGQTEDQRVIGTGLGLSIARKMVERMGGTLALESEPGKGSVFSFTVPLALSTEEAYQTLQKEKELTEIVMKGSFRILVVEDNPSNQIVTEGMLEKILPESSAILAEDGFKAMALLVKEKFDLVLMDIRMPGIDGYETTRRLRLLDNENAHVPVIALTASVIRSDIDHCLEAGMNGYVPKPVSRGILAKTIRDMLKIPWDERFRVEEAKKENFLTGLKDRPAWSDRLFELCNGKKDRFIQILTFFVEQSETETGNWQAWIDQKQHEPLAFSIHKLLPNIRIFLDEKMTAMAVVLDQELRKGWSESHVEDILALKEAVLGLHREAEELMGYLIK